MHSIIQLSGAPVNELGYLFILDEFERVQIQTIATGPGRLGNMFQILFLFMLLGNNAELIADNERPGPKLKLLMRQLRGSNRAFFTSPLEPLYTYY